VWAAVLVGPHTFNFEEATRLAIEAGAACRVSDAADLMANALSLLNDAPTRVRMVKLAWRSPHAIAARRRGWRNWCHIGHSAAVLLAMQVLVYYGQILGAEGADSSLERQGGQQISIARPGQVAAGGQHLLLASSTSRLVRTPTSRPSLWNRVAPGSRSAPAPAPHAGDAAVDVEPGLTSLQARFAGGHFNILAGPFLVGDSFAHA